MGTRPPVIDPSEAPRDAVHSALTWLADVFEEATVIRSKQALRWTRGTVQFEVHFQSSTYSRREVGAWAWLSVQVLDAGFARWRSRNAHLTWRSGPHVHVSGSLPPSVALYGDDTGHRRLPELPGFIGNDLLPVLDVFDTPIKMASEYDVAGIWVFSCMEWAVYKGDIEAARLLLTRYVDGAHPAKRARIDQARAAGLPPRGTPIQNDLDWWGPTLEKLGILAEGEALPGAAGPAAPLRDERLRVATILSEFGPVTNASTN